MSCKPKTKNCVKIAEKNGASPVLDYTQIQSSNSQKEFDARVYLESGIDQPNLDGMNLRESNLSSLLLKNASFKGADLSKSNISSSQIIEVDFSGSDLSGVNFENSYIYDVTFDGANMRKVSLKGAIIIDTDFSKAIGIQYTGKIKEYDCYAVDWEDKVMFKIGDFWGEEEAAVEFIKKIIWAV